MHVDGGECLQEAREALETAEGEVAAAQERVRTLEKDFQVVQSQQAAFQSARHQSSSQQVFFLMPVISSISCDCYMIPCIILLPNFF